MAMLSSKKSTSNAFDEALKYALSSLKLERFTLKSKQIEAVRHLSQGLDVFVWFPTGFGKSICYQVMPFVFDSLLGRTSVSSSEQSVVLVVSPLVSLMIDQVESLRARDVDAAIISSNKGINRSLTATECDIRSGRYKLLYCSPEVLIGDLSSKWSKLLVSPPLCSTLVTIAIDEAHCVYKWSDEFRPCYSRLNELRAFAPPGTPLLAVTATVTESMRRQIVKTLDMRGCQMVSVSPNKPNMYYEVVRRTSEIGDDLLFLTTDLLIHNIKATRTIVYCQSLDVCANLYIFFHTVLGDSSYYPQGAEKVSDNRLFGMYHAKTDEYNKFVISKSLSNPDGIVRVVFATMALGMGVDFRGLTRTIHYGAPKSIEDYYQESGRAGRAGELSTSTIYWIPSDVPNKKNKSNPHNVEVDAVRDYLMTTGCRRQYLLKCFDSSLISQSSDCESCCDNCKAKLTEIHKCT